MPITKSAKKSYVSSERKRAHNLVLKNKLKKALKGVNKENSNETISIVDKMAKRHIISKNKASRLKSRITKKFGTPKQLKTSASAKATADKQNKNAKLKKVKVSPKKSVAKKPTPKPKTSSQKK